MHDGMLASLAVETLAHEAVHVWCREQGVDFAPDSGDEEGTCNVIDRLALQRLSQQYDVPMRLADLFRNPYLVYGERLRQQSEFMIHLDGMRTLQRFGTVARRRRSRFAPLFLPVSL